MTENNTLLDAINELETTLGQSAGLANENFKDNRKEAVQLRRVIADHLAALYSLGSVAFESAELREGFRSEFAKMRSTMAFHHASWPVVAIDLENPDYLTSIATLRESNRRFISWVRNALSASK